jgi:hypothetical protein
MLVELRVENYVTLDYLANGLDDILKTIDKPFQNHSHGYIFKTFKLESTQDLRIHKCTKKFPRIEKKLDTNFMKNY